MLVAVCKQLFLVPQMVSDSSNILTQFQSHYRYGKKSFQLCSQITVWFNYLIIFLSKNTLLLNGLTFVWTKSILLVGYLFDHFWAKMPCYEWVKICINKVNVARGLLFVNSIIFWLPSIFWKYIIRIALKYLTF